jgi:FSR family fosmidomycin resistance protein-like MFS transporter
LNEFVARRWLKSSNQKTLIACCGAHLIQDGMGALQYVLLPILAQAFGLNYAQVGLLRAVSSTVMSVLEIPAGVLAEKFGEPALLMFGLACTSAGYLGVAFATDFDIIVLGFFVVGVGAAFQHSLASALITGNFDSANHRRALGVYNSSGDLGKLAFTSVFSLGLGVGLAWNASVVLLSLLTLVFLVSIPFLTRNANRTRPHYGDNNHGDNPGATRAKIGWGIKKPNEFVWLSITVFLDSMMQAVFLTFIAFVLLDKGVGEGMASIAVVLALSGGMVGKFCCGFLAARFGDRKTFVFLQILSVTGLLLLTVLPAMPTLIFLPLLGLAVQGTSTVTYGSVSEFIDINRQSRGYALIYTLASASSVAGPFIFGFIADRQGLDISLMILALISSVTLFTSFVLRR